MPLLKNYIVLLKKNRTSYLSFYARMKTKTVLESLKDFLQNVRNFFSIFFFRFYILCDNFSKIGPIIKKIPKFSDDPYKIGSFHLQTHSRDAHRNFFEDPFLNLNFGKTSYIWGGWALMGYEFSKRTNWTILNMKNVEESINVIDFSDIDKSYLKIL